MKKITFLLFFLLGPVVANYAKNSPIHTEFVCPVPSTMAVNDVTMTSASFVWTAGASETAWEILILQDGSSAPTASTAGIAVMETPSYSTTTLNSGLLYRVYVRANCGSEFSSWSSSFNFYTPCTAITEFNENFETTAVNVLPTCWAAVLNGGGIATAAFVKVANSNSYAGGKAVQLSNSSSASGANVMLVSPLLSNLSAGTHRLKFYAKSNTAAATIQIGTATSNGSDASFDLIETVPATPVYTEYLIEFTLYAGTNTFLAIRNSSSTYTSIYLDNIRWEIAPSCEDVTQIAIPEVTPNSATVTWTPAMGQLEWDVVYGDATVTDPSTLTPISPAVTTSPQTTIPGLLPNTNYKVWVRSACGGTDGDGAWIGPVSFLTACSAVDAINENLETTANDALPNCWSKILRGASLSTSAFVKTVSSNVYAGTKAIQMNNYNSPIDSDIILVSPNLATLATGTHRVRFYAKSSTPNGSIELGTLNTGTNQGDFNHFETVSITNNYAEYVVDFSTYQGSNTYIGIRHSSGSATSIYLDNIIWEEAPSCADVTNLMVNGTSSDSVSLSWIVNGGESQWDIVYGPMSATDPSTLTPISPAPTTNIGAVISGLTENTTYKFWVRSVCAGNENGYWIGPITVSSACLPISSFDENFDSTAVGVFPGCWKSILTGTTLSTSSFVTVYGSGAVSGTNCVRMNNTNSGEEAKIMLVSPNLSNIAAATHRLKFYARGNSGVTTLDIGTLNNDSNTGTFTSFLPISLTEQYAEYNLDFGSYSGTDTYIAFRNTSVEGYKLIYIDDIKWEEIPVCADVTDITVTDKTTTLAMVNWLAGNSETNWQVAYGVATITDPALATISELLTDTNLSLEELTAATTYNVWVRSVCGGDNGNWMGPIAFNTECYETGLFNENFDSVSFPDLPVCWSKILVGTTTGADISVVPYSGTSEPNSVQLYGEYSGAGAKVILVSPPLNTLSSGNHQLKFKGMASHTLQIGTLNGNTSEATFTPFGNVVVLNESTAQSVVIDFSAYEGTDTYIGFRLNGDGENSYATLDDVVWEETLSSGSFDKSRFSYYPNPVKDVLNIAYQDNITNIAVFNLLGQKVMESKGATNSVKVDMSALAAGSYIVKVTSNNQINSIKVMKE